MGANRRSKKRIVAELAANYGWVSVGEREWEILRRQVPQLRTEHVATAGVPAEAPWSGVRQRTLDELETSLRELARVYEERPHLKSFCRAEVIRAKDKARAISRSTTVAPEKRSVRAEMVEWMLVWLSDPALFEVWSQIRRQRLNARN